MPVTIDYYAHPFSDRPPQRHEADSVGQWLLDTFGPNPCLKPHVFRGEPDAENEITNDVKSLMAKTGHYTVLQVAGDPLSAQAFLFGKEVIDLFVPEVPTQGLRNTTQQSANNQLGNRTNQARIIQRIEDIYGEVRSIPTLIAPSYTKYVDNTAFEYNQMCVGRGYYDISDVRDGETPLDLITGSGAKFYDPFESPQQSDTPILIEGDNFTAEAIIPTRSNEVDGITLLAPNQANTTEADSYTYTKGSVSGVTRDKIEQPTDSGPAFGEIFSDGDSVTISMSPYDTSVTDNGISASSSSDQFSGPVGVFDTFFEDAQFDISGFTDGTIDGTYTILSISGDGSTITTYESVPASESAGNLITVTQETIDYSGTRTVLDVGTKHIFLTGFAEFAFGPSNYSSTVKLTGNPEWSNWVIFDSTTADAAFSNIIAPQGMYKDSGSGKTSTSVSYEMEVEELDASLVPTGTVETFSQSISGSTSSERGKTLEATPSFGGPFRVRMRRTTNFDFSFSGALVDEIKWADAYSTAPVGVDDFGDVTTVFTLTKATTRATAVKERQFNCLVSRKLPTYDGTAFSGVIADDGSLQSGTITATKRFIDIVAAVSKDPQIGNIDITSELDVDQIWGVYQQVSAWRTEFGDFSYTFDDDNTSFEETVRNIADACFCQAFRQNNKIRFHFEQATANSTALFTHRNKRPDAETITRSFAADSDYDGVEFTYVDPDTEKQETFKLPETGAVKYKRFDIPGIREFSTAYIRAYRELNKLKFQRKGIETEVTQDGRLVAPFSRIDIVDNTRFQSYDGEVIGQNGLEIILSQSVQFTAGEAHSIVFIKRDGSIESISCTEGSSDNRVVLDSSPSESLVTDFTEDGIRTIYSFAADIDRDAQAWLVQEITPRDQYIAIRAVNYADEYYQNDNDTIPPSNTIIN